MAIDDTIDITIEPAPAFLSRMVVPPIILSLLGRKEVQALLTRYQYDSAIALYTLWAAPKLHHYNRQVRHLAHKGHSSPEMALRLQRLSWTLAKNPETLRGRSQESRVVKRGSLVTHMP